MKELNELVSHAQIADAESTNMYGVEPDKVFAIWEAFRALEQRAEAAEAKLALVREQRDSELNRNTELEAKLAELEESHSQVVEARDLYKKMCANRPAPAINLADLVPDEMPTSHIYHGGNGAFNAGKEAGWNACRAAILSNIEEQSQ